MQLPRKEIFLPKLKPESDQNSRSNDQVTGNPKDKHMKRHYADSINKIQVMRKSTELITEFFQ